MTLASAASWRLPSLRMLARVHALLGLIPLGGYLVYHLVETWSALEGREAWVDRGGEHGPRALIVVLVLLPLALHALLGIARLLRQPTDPLTGARGMRTLQALTGLHRARVHRVSRRRGLVGRLGPARRRARLLRRGLSQRRPAAAPRGVPGRPHRAVLSRGARREPGRGDARVRAHDQRAVRASASSASSSASRCGRSCYRCSATSRSARRCFEGESRRCTIKMTARRGRAYNRGPCSA